MYHAHVYFPLREQDKAQALNEIIRQERQDVLRVFPLVGRLVGPHKMPMFEIHLESLSEEFLAWLDTIRGDFSVLIHPVSEESCSITQNARFGWAERLVYLKKN